MRNKAKCEKNDEIWMTILYVKSSMTTLVQQLSRIPSVWLERFIIQRYKNICYDWLHRYKLIHVSHTQYIARYVIYGKAVFMPHSPLPSLLTPPHSFLSPNWLQDRNVYSLTSQQNHSQSYVLIRLCKSIWIQYSLCHIQGSKSTNVLSLIMMK